jgi:hypothetical protein
MKTAALCFIFTLATWPNAATVTKLVDHGPDDNRILFVILGDGFTEAEQGEFNGYADSIIQGFQSFEPWKTYWNFINFYRLNVFSLESGCSTPETSKTTPFDGFYYEPGGSPRLGIEGSKVQDTLNYYFTSRITASFLIAHYPKEAGTGFGGLSALTSSPRLKYTALHEIGHSFGGLADEYSLAGPMPADASEPNVAIPPDTGRNTVKWKAWVEPDSLWPDGEIVWPTPLSLTYADFVGLNEGCKYSDYAYRPERVCMMSNATNPYCRICLEALVLKIHEQVKMLESITPSVPTVYYNFYPTSYFVQPLDQGDIEYTIAWLLDFTSLPEHGNSITLQPWDLGQSPHVLQAIITDTTYCQFWRTISKYFPFVKNDPYGLMRDTVTWNLLYGDDIKNQKRDLASAQYLEIRTAGRLVSIDAQHFGDLRIYNLQGQLLKAFPGRGAAHYQWQAPSNGMYFVRMLGQRPLARKVVVLE